MLSEEAELAQATGVWDLLRLMQWAANEALKHVNEALTPRSEGVGLDQVRALSPKLQQASGFIRETAERLIQICAGGPLNAFREDLLRIFGAATELGNLASNDLLRLPQKEQPSSEQEPAPSVQPGHLGQGTKGETALEAKPAERGRILVV